MHRRNVVVAGTLVLSLFVLLACGSKDDDGPPPSIGGATYVERPPDATLAPGTP